MVARLSKSYPAFAGPTRRAARAARGGVDQRLEQPRVAGQVRERLHMPLHAEVERLAVALDRLHDPVVRPRHGAQPAAEPVDGLVVERVHVEVLGADDLGQARAALDPHVVGRLAARRGLAVGDRAVADVRHVLVQRAAARDVEDLAAAADAEHREAERVRAADDGELEGVELRLHGPEPRVALGAVGGRVEVRAAGHADARQVVDQRRDPVVVERRQHDRASRRPARPRARRPRRAPARAAAGRPAGAAWRPSCAAPPRW